MKILAFLTLLTSLFLVWGYKTPQERDLKAVCEAKQAAAFMAEKVRRAPLEERVALAKKVRMLDMEESILESSYLAFWGAIPKCPD